MKEYDFKAIESKWQQTWKERNIYQVRELSEKPKFYVLDMFPYPSGAGLHVGHPLGYIASDIYARFKRLNGYNVLHPMGYDSFGLPAEQYAIQTGQHPAITTENNIKRYREQLDKMGFSYDWDREVRTSDPAYYRWTQWIFIQLFESWYNPKTNKAEPIETLVQQFETKGFKGSSDKRLTGGTEYSFPTFSAEEWKSFSEEQRQRILLGFRLAYLDESFVNWCPALGTVLSNDEVKDGVSERGGYPVERKLMNQWSMRITAYAERLLKDLETIDWSESLKETQRNWIGKSQGASIHFKVQDSTLDIEVFTTRPDTLFGVSYLAIAPEHEMLDDLVAAEYWDDVMNYVAEAKNRSERERMSEVKKVSGVFTGMYALHPFTGQELPIWVADYVLAGYGTGAVMAVPGHDSRDFVFARHFNLPVIQVIEAPEGHDITQHAYDGKEGKLIHSDFLNGLDVKPAIKKAIETIEKMKLGKGKTNYRLRDAIFGRQRYWGEPIPVYYKNGVPYCIPSQKLPLELPVIDKFLPTEDGEPPLARAANWMWNEEKGTIDQSGYPIETTTMPGWAGSSWYFLRYMDPQNQETFAGQEAIAYWKQVDLYFGGSEHATGHLLYVRFWTKFLFDRGFIPVQEPARKLINQGMIQGRSNFVYRVDYTNLLDGKNEKTTFLLSKNIFQKYSNDDDQISGRNFLSFLEDFNIQLQTSTNNRLTTSKLHVDVNLVENDELNIEKVKTWRPDFADATFILEDGRYLCGHEVEKMSKSKHNVVTPDHIIETYGADTLRLYEMFLGPLEQSKPWNTQGIEGVQRFLKKLWRLYVGSDGAIRVIDLPADKAEKKILHTLIRKVGEDIEKFSFNTSVPAFMICTNELTELNCRKKEILEPLLICLSPFAPHLAEELWQMLGHHSSVLESKFPSFNPEFLVEDSFFYPVSINGKHRTNIEIGLDATQAQVEAILHGNPVVQKWLEGKQPKKVVYVKGKIVNVVI